MGSSINFVNIRRFLHIMYSITSILFLDLDFVIVDFDLDFVILDLDIFLK